MLTKNKLHHHSPSHKHLKDTCLVVLFSLAAIGNSEVASAQTSVTFFGNVDAGVGHYSATGAGSVNSFQYGAYIPNFWGLRGSEDLGGGMSANFWLESGFDIGNGGDPGTAGSGYDVGRTGSSGIAFQRRSTISLSTQFGEIRLGRDFTADYSNKAQFDPTNVNGVGSSFQLFMSGFDSTMNDVVWASNTIQYLYGFAPNSAVAVGKGGPYVQLMVAPSERANSASGAYTGGRVGYTNGIFNVALGGANVPAVVNGSSMKVVNVGGSYDFGIAKLMSKFNINHSGDSTVNNRALLIGGQIPMWNGYIPVSVIRYKSTGSASNGASAKQFSIGYVYSMSKHTSLYTTYGHVANSGGATFGLGALSPTVANGSAGGYEIGMQHSF